MPRVRETEVTGFAHCADAWCSGSQVQTEVPAVRTETAHTYQEKGGDAPGEENSFVTFRFADKPADGSCPVCRGPRELTDQKRPVYQPLTAAFLGVPATQIKQDELLRIDVNNPAGGQDDRVAQLERELAELRDMVKDRAAA